MIKKIFIAILSIILLLAAFAFWSYKLLDHSEFNGDLKQTKKSEIHYLSENLAQPKGKILAVVTSHNQLGNTGKKAGYELTELSRAYWVFEANGFSVDIASPKGGEPTMVIDEDDMNHYDYAFLNDTEIQHKLKSTIKLSEIKSDDYQAIYFVGGKGTMFDFVNNSQVTTLTESFYQNGKIIAAVCHGPAALLDAKKENGDYILADKQVTAFTNEEELFLIPEAETIFPFLLQDKLTEQSTQFSQGDMYLNNVVADGQVVTGQNPWSTWAVAESTITQLGYSPKYRKLTAEEQAIKLLAIFKQSGSDQAISYAVSLNKAGKSYMRNLVFLHGVMEFMKLNPLKGIKLFILVQRLKNLQV